MWAGINRGPMVVLVGTRLTANWSGIPVLCRLPKQVFRHETNSLLHIPHFVHNQETFGRSFTGFLAVVAPLVEEPEGSEETLMERPWKLAVVLTEAESPPASDSDSVSVRSNGLFIMGAASTKLNGSTSVPFPKNVTSKENSSLVSVPARAIVMCCKASFLRAVAFPSNSAANLNNLSD